MSVDDLDLERAQMKTKWAKARAQAKARRVPPHYAGFTDQRLTPRQVAARVQRAAGEALADLYRRRREEGEAVREK